MAGEENLIPFGDLTEEEQRKIASMGGKASVKARREKKRLTAAVEAVLNAKAPDKVVSQMKKNGVEGNDYYAALGYAVVAKALKGDVSAFNSVRDIIGENPTNNIAVTGEVNNPFSGLSTEELREILKDG